jgi:hypothetical protein
VASVANTATWVLDPLTGARVLALDTDDAPDLLGVAGFVEHQRHPIRLHAIRQILRYVGPCLGTGCLVVPARPTRQVLYPV